MDESKNQEWQRWYLIDPKDGYPLGPYANEAAAEHVRSLDGRGDQIPRKMHPQDAETTRRRLLLGRRA